jgi:hypothetical protein
MEAKKDNVIKFPGGKNKPVTTTENQPPRGMPATTRSPAKALVGIAVMAVLSLSANRWLNKDGAAEQASSGGRAIASVGQDHAIEPGERDADWERNLAKEISSSERSPASVRVGQRPTLEDQLRFSELRSQYFLDLTDGKLNEIRFTRQTAGDDENVVHLKDRAAFLMKYKSLIPMDFAAASSITREETATGIAETFALLNGDQVKVGEARFSLDKYGRLMGLKFAAPTTVQ